MMSVAAPEDPTIEVASTTEAEDSTVGLIATMAIEAIETTTLEEASTIGLAIATLAIETEIVEDSIGRIVRVATATLMETEVALVSHRRDTILGDKAIFN